MEFKCKQERKKKRKGKEKEGSVDSFIKKEKRERKVDQD